MSASDPRRILLIRPSALGDVARTVPALVSVRRAFPDASIDWLVRDAFADAVSHHSDLTGVVPFPRARFRGFGRSWSVTRDALAWLRELRGRDYDYVIDLQGLSRSGLFAWVTGAKRRAGFADARELAWLGYNRRHRISPGVVHTVDQMLALIEAEGMTPVHDLRLYVGEPDRQWAERWLAEQDLTGRRFAVLAPTAMWASKQWPIDRFDALAERLGDEGIEASVIVGSPPEVNQTRALVGGQRKMRRVDAVGRTSVGQLMALMQRAMLAVCNDSAALHLAVGLGVRRVGLFGPTDPAKVGPYRDDGSVVRADIFDTRVHYRDRNSTGLIERIGVEQVLRTVRRVLAGGQPRVVWEAGEEVGDRR
ncbi:MAG: glycosyltransferase family 9 protein [Phycisphaeraceae bacterium]